MGKRARKDAAAKAAEAAATPRRAKAKPASPFRALRRLAGDALVEHLAVHADALRLNANEQRRLHVALKMVAAAPVIALMHEVGIPWQPDYTPRIAEIGERLRDSVVDRGDPKAPKPERVVVDIGLDDPGDADKPIEPLVWRLLENAAKLGLSNTQRGELLRAWRLHVAAPEGADGAADRDAADQVARAIRDQLMDGLSETVALERARGGVVTTSQGSGADRVVKVRCHDRDGLAALYDAGELGAGVEPDIAGLTASRRMAVGLNFRELHERRSAGLRSQLCGDIGCGRGDYDAVAAGASRAFDTERLKTVEAFVAVTCGERALMALRMVAGEGRLITSIEHGGNSVRLNKAALNKALDAAAAADWRPIRLRRQKAA